jgi:hypothetical protein
MRSLERHLEELVPCKLLLESDLMFLGGSDLSCCPLIGANTKLDGLLEVRGEQREVLCGNGVTDLL